MAKAKATEVFDKGRSLLDGLAESGGVATADPDAAASSATEQTTVVEQTAPQSTAADDSTVTTPPVESQQPAQESTTSPSDASAAARYLGKIKELGFENVESDEDAINRLIESYQKTQQQFQQVQTAYQQAQPWVQYGQQYLQQLQNPAYQQFQAQTQTPSTQQKQEAPDPTKWWSPPQYDPAVVDKYREIVVDANTGEKRLEWKSNTPAEVRASVEAHQAYREKWAEELVSNPQKALQPFKQEVLHEVKKELQEMFGSTEQQREVQTFAQRIKEENADWMFETDPRTGRTAVDPISGQPVWSESGKLAAHFIEQAEQLGISDPYKQWHYAVVNLQAMSAQQMMNQQASQSQQTQQVPAPSPVQVAEDKKQELLNRGRNGANSIPSRGGSVPPVEADPRRTRSQNKNLSAGQKILADLRKEGIGVG